MLFHLLLASSLSFGAADSVLVAHRPEKVVVQINERGALSRLQKLMNAWGAERELFWQTPDQSFYLDCGRNSGAATCLMRFTPSEFVQIGAKDVRLDYLIEGERAPQDHAVEFLGSRGHFARLRVTNGQLLIEAHRP